MNRFYLPLTIVGVLFPLSVHGATLSPWVQGVIDKADTGIATSRALPAGPCTDPTIISEIQNNLSLVRTLFSVSANLAVESQFLRERTACFQNDRLLIIAKMNDVLTEMNTATLACNQSGVHALRDTFRFLVDAYQSFIKGAVDPSYEDSRLRTSYPFETEAGWKAAGKPVSLTGSLAPLCPFTTDFGPHALAYVPVSFAPVVPGSPGFELKSYGCDASVLRTLDPALQTETKALADFIVLSDTYARLFYTTVSQALQSVDSIVAVLTGKVPPGSISGVIPAPPHEKRDGCLRPPSPDMEGSVVTGDVERAFFAYPEYFSEQYAREITDANGIQRSTYGPLPADTLPTWLLFRPANDFFLSLPNSIILSRAFTDQYESFGSTRPQPGGFFSEMFDVISLVRELDTMPQQKLINSNIERETAIVTAMSRDAIERTDTASAPLRTAVRSLSSVVDDFLPKTYIPSYTFFLRRFCVDGHCNKTLDAVAHRAFNPYCHPYISGKYTEDDVPAKCFCQGKYADEDYCTGASAPSAQPPEEFVCEQE